jgi:hypothetical protein
MSKPTARYILFLALAVVTFHWKTLLTNQFTTLVGSEGVNQAYSWLHFWVRSVWHGTLPLWDPYTFGGRPFPGETQTTAWYPVHLLFALVPFNRHGVLSPRFYHEYLAFNQFLCALLMFALLRELRRSRFASFIGACAFAMGGLMAHMPWPHQLEACIWMPAILLFLLRSFRAHNERRALMEASLAGLCLGLSILTGGMQFAMLEAICVVLAAFWYGATHHDTAESRIAWRRAGVAAFTLIAIAAAVGAVQLAGSFQYGHYALRYIKGGAFPMSEKIPYGRMDNGVWPFTILTALFPTAGGDTGGESWAIYVGALPFFLAVAALWRSRSSIWIRFFAGISVLAFLYALGEFSPLNGVLYAVVPYLWMNREPSRFLFLVCFSIAALSAFGLDDLLEERLPRDRIAPILKWIAIAAAVFLVVPGLFAQKLLGIWTCLSLIIVLACCAWCGWLLRHRPSRTASLLLAVFVLFDLGMLNWGEADKNSLPPESDLYAQMMTLSGPAAFVRSQPGLHRVRVMVDPQPNIGDVYQVQSIWGGGVTILRDYSQLSAHDDVLNVRYRIRPATTPDPGAVYQDAHWKVYRDDKAFPRAWIVHDAAVVPSDNEVYARMAKSTAALRQVALLPSPLPAPLDKTATGDSLHFTSYAPNSMSLDAQAAGDGLLVLSEIWYPGWRATVNGQDAEVRRVDGGLRGILLKRGANRVVLTYAPTAEYAGLAISLAAIFFCGWCGFRVWKDTSTTPTAKSLTASESSS